MSGLLVRTDRGDLSVTFQLSTFITDWEAARRTFVACIADSFRELLSPQPSDFSAASPSELSETWCKYRIFGGSSTIVLRVDSLTLSFPNILNADRQIVAEVIQRALSILLSAVGGYQRQSYVLAANYHMHVVDGRWDTYLARHGSSEIEEAAKGDSSIEYRPSISFILRTKDRYRVLRRMIEQSEVLQNGLFISDRIFVSMPSLTELEEELNWIKQIDRLADRVSGLTYQKS